MQDYGFDYSDGDGADDAVSVDVENMYYTAKCMPLVLSTTVIPLIQISQQRKKSLLNKL
jgi:hypothetical protein